MALADYQPESRVINFKSGSFQVFGLGLNEVTTLVRTHLPDLEALWELGDAVLAGKADFGESELAQIASAFADQAPGFVANVIALASRETDEHGNVLEAAITAASKLSIGLQVHALMAIGEVTFAEVGGIKKAWESVAGLLTAKGNKTAMTKVLQKVKRRQ